MEKPQPDPGMPSKDASWYENCPDPEEVCRPSRARSVQGLRDGLSARAARLSPRQYRTSMGCTWDTWKALRDRPPRTPNSRNAIDVEPTTIESNTGRVHTSASSSFEAAQISQASSDLCLNCHQYGPSVDDCLRCFLCQHEDYTVCNCNVSKAIFHKFMELVPELREHIYSFALASDRAILPHLCDSTLKFHDDNTPQQHGAISKLLNLTRVSKQVRDESLPIFYSTNTFMVGKDTATYFARLEHLGRFQWIRHVQFVVDTRKEASAAMIFRNLTQYIREAETYEKKLVEQNEVVTQSENHMSKEAEVSLRRSDEDKAYNTPGFSNNQSVVKEEHEIQSVSSLVGASFTSLTNHPQYLSGGLSELSVFIVLRKLTSMTTSANGIPSHQLVLPVPRTSIFTQFGSLKWFPAIWTALGIDLHLVPNVPLDHVGDGIIMLTWHQRLQKRDFCGCHVCSICRASKSTAAEAAGGRGSAEAHRRPHDTLVS